MLYIKINDLTLGGRNSKYHIQAPIAGLAKAPIRMGYSDWSGRDGGYVSSQLFSAREIVITGFYKGSTCEEADELRFALTEALPIRQSLPTYINTFSDKLRFTQAYLKDLKMDLTNDRMGQFQIALICPDPFFYEAGDGSDPNSGWNELPVNKLIGGGYVTEYDMPVQWTPGTTPAIATNSGDIMVYPQFTITGKVQNPMIINHTLNKFVKIELTTTSDNDVIVIDMAQRLITLNGGNILSYRSSDSQWWGLEKGDNVIEFTSDGSSDVDVGMLRWRTPYLGI